MLGALLKEGRRRYTASDLDLRSADLQFLLSSCHDCGLAPLQENKVATWAKTGTWSSDVQVTIGAVLLRQAARLSAYGSASQSGNSCTLACLGLPNAAY